MLEQDSHSNVYLGLLRQTVAPPPQRRGRILGTGRYETREALVEAVWRDRENTTRNLTEIGRMQGVSATVVASILRGKRPSTLGRAPYRSAVQPFKPASTPAMSDGATVEPTSTEVACEPLGQGCQACQ